MAAGRVVVSYPADLSDWGRDQLETPWVRAYLRRKLAGARAAGRTVEVFLDVGCCGGTLDVPLRVERLHGDGPVGEDTDVEYVVREACGLSGGWLVQSRAGPSGGTADGRTRR